MKRGGGGATDHSAVDTLAYAALFEHREWYNLRCLLTLLLSLTGGKSVNTLPEREVRLISYIRSSYATATLTEAAELLRLSPAYLSRLCKERFGESFKELLMKERFSAAVNLLTETDMPIGDIISTVGYENNSYFHKEFKRRFDTTPYSYRMAARQKM